MRPSLSAVPTDPAAIPPTFLADPVLEVAKPRPLTTITASAQRITQKKLKENTAKRAKASGGGWQADAWALSKIVGEQRFLANTLAGRMAQARLYVGQLSEDQLAAPEPTEDPELQRLITSLGDSHSGRSQLIHRMGINLFIAGDGYLVGVPSRLMPGGKQTEDDAPDVHQDLSDDNLTAETVDDLEWNMLSVSEVSYTAEAVRLKFGEGASDTVEVSADEIFIIRVWRADPEKSWEADSPTRSSMPVLRELVGLTMHISAQIDSRLAGAGLLVVPESAVRALKVAQGLPEDGEDDPFTDALIEAMVTPIQDRESASAVVPLVAVVPDEATGKFEHISFSQPLDTQAKDLRDEAIRRLALGQDAPPELLLGTAGMNHWGAWLVREDVVSTHLEPPLALICDALTTQYLRPMMRAQGYSEEMVDNYVVWYSVDHLVSRPSRGQDADRLYERGVISDVTLREAHGFDEDDAPESSKLDEAALTALEMVKANPSLFRDPGLQIIVEQLRAVIDGVEVPVIETPVPEGEDITTDDDDTSDRPGGSPSEVTQDEPQARQGLPATGPGA